MLWFTNKKKRLEMMQGIRPTSKATLKLQCLFCCKGDIDEATKLYEFFAKDMPNLPDYEPVPPTWIDNTKDMANSLVGWLGEHKDTLAGAYSFIREAIVNKGLPPIGEAASAAAEALPSINE